jgi:hypothetical protein
LKNTILSLLIAVGLIGSARNATALIYPYQFTNLNNPNGANGTTISGISGNKIIGGYNDSNGIDHSFIYNGNNYMPLDYGAGTVLTGISGSTIIGNYGPVIGTGFNTPGFIYDGSNFTSLVHPSAVNGTVPTGVSGTTIVGIYYDSNYAYHNFMYDGNTFSTLDYIANGIFPSGITDSTIFGTYDGGGFIYDGNNLTTLNHPKAVYGTFPTGVSKGIIVGTYIGENNNNGWENYGFIYDGNSFNTVDYGVNGTIITGISDSTIVGFYDDENNISNGFIAIIPEPSTYALFGFGAIGMLMVFRRKKTV